MHLWTVAGAVDDTPHRPAHTVTMAGHHPCGRPYARHMTESGFDDPLPAHGVRDLREKVRRRIDELTRESLDNPMVDLGLAVRIGDALGSLLDSADDLDATGRLAVRGAVEYFVLSRDEQPDTDSRHGFVDDATVLNTTCDQVGLPEFKVRLD